MDRRLIIHGGKICMFYCIILEVMMGWGGVGLGGGASNVLRLHSHRCIFLRNQRYVTLRMLRWWQICTLPMLRWLHVCTPWLGEKTFEIYLNAKTFLNAKFDEDPTFTRILQKRKKDTFANIEHTQQVETHIIAMI